MLSRHVFTLRTRLAVAALVTFAATLSARADDPVTFNKHVAPILFKRCAGCHHPGEVAPFSLLSYKDAAKRAGFLKEVTAKRRMPPWKAQAGFGEFRDTRSLSDEELQTLARWADTGAMEGDAKDLPMEPKFDDGWRLGKPDLVVKMPDLISVPAGGREVFRNFEIPTGLTEDVTLAGWEFRPGNPRVVHHANLRISAGEEARMRKQKLPGGPGGPIIVGSLGGWVPGATPSMLPDNVGALVRKGSNIVFQMHYHPVGKPENDQSMLALYFTKKKADNLIATLTVGSTFKLSIPAGEKEYRTSASYTLPVDVHIISVGPHMHLLGREMKVTAKLPDGKVEPMIWIKDWDFNWQGHYRYVKPLPLPKGTIIEMQASFDNSADNPKNPFNPPKLIQGGPTTTDEMCQCNIILVTERPASRPILMRDMQEKNRERREMMQKAPKDKTP